MSLSHETQGFPSKGKQDHELFKTLMVLTIGVSGTSSLRLFKKFEAEFVFIFEEKG